MWRVLKSFSKSIFKKYNEKDALTSSSSSQIFNRKGRLLFLSVEGWSDGGEAA